jgi:predicted nucleotidyltransferase
MSDRFEQCSWPRLSEPHGTALQSAVHFIFREVDPIGIVAAGTILRGTQHPSSDLDVYVVHDAPFRRRVQRFFGNHVPTEIFINPPSAIRAYFAEEHEEGRPLTAHMLATGHVVFHRGAELDILRHEAQGWLDRQSFPNEMAAIRARYGAATTFEDAADVADDDPAAASMLIAHAVTDMLEFWCRAKTGRIPRRKDLLVHVADLNPALGALGRRVFLNPSFAEREAAAAEIADMTVGVRGFFEWDSGCDAVTNEPAKHTCGPTTA